MKIGIDVAILRGKDAGSLRVFEQLIVGLVEFAPENEYHIWGNTSMLRSDAVPSSSCLYWHNVELPRQLPAALMHQILLPRYIRERLDVLHSPIFAPPLSYSGKTVMTVFDLTFRLYPETMKWTGRLWWQLLGPRGFEKADRIITLSENTKRDLCKYFRIQREKVKVVYPCTRTIFKPDPAAKRVVRKYNLPDEYLLYVGTLEPRKNVVNLVRAYALTKRIKPFEYPLVLCGKRGWLSGDIFRTIEELGLVKDVILLGYVPDRDLPGLYTAAKLFIYLSFYEGFGLPVLEAMACGTPVLTSNTASLPEVVGDAGVMVSPNNLQQIASEIVHIISDPELSIALSHKGLERASFFSIERNIRQTLDVYMELQTRF